MKKIKMLLPALAFLFAIGASLAANFKTSESFLVTDVAAPSGSCTKVGTCAGTGSTCVDASSNAYRPINATGCSGSMNGPFSL